MGGGWEGDGVEKEMGECVSKRVVANFKGTK